MMYFISDKAYSDSYWPIQTGLNYFKYLYHSLKYVMVTQLIRRLPQASKFSFDPGRAEILCFSLSLLKAKFAKKYLSEPISVENL